MSTAVSEVRRLIEHRGPHRVVSLYLDLDPERFATAPARSSQVRSLIDQATREVDQLGELGHEDKVALREDLKRVDSFLSSGEAPYRGARGLAVFCSGPDQLFETFQLDRPVEPRVVIEATPYVEPMIADVQRRNWLVALVSRGSARLLSGPPERLRECERIGSDTHGQHDQGGWSQANYERSVEKEALNHLRAVAEAVDRRWRQERFDRVAIGGPNEVLARFRELLGAEVRERLAREALDVDLSKAGEDQLAQAVQSVVAADERRREAEALDRLVEGMGRGGRAVAGIEDTLRALNERRVQTLLLAPGFTGRGSRCPSCGLLVAGGASECPADGARFEPVQALREPVVQAALAQDAEVLPICHLPEREPREGLAALLRF